MRLAGGVQKDIGSCTLKKAENPFPVHDCCLGALAVIALMAVTKMPQYGDSSYIRCLHIEKSIKEPEVPFTIISSVKPVHFDGDCDFAVLAQSPDYTPKNADSIKVIFREYIIEK